MSEDLLDCLLSSAGDINLDFEAALSGTNVDSISASHINTSSVVHTGDTDSSDDEDNRNFENRTLSDCGKSIKNSLSTADPKCIKEVTKTWSSKPVAKASAPVEPSKLIFGIRVINPLVASNVIEERLNNREIVAFNRLKFFIRNIPSDKDWVIAGAIIQKTVKTSRNDKKYCMWTLSDLKPDLKSVAVFLFGSAYKELWKTSVGMVVGILNPSVFEGKDGYKEEASFSVNNHQKIMVLGQSRDYATCKSVKKDGERCTAFVNKSTCEYCLYHVKQAYQQFSKRSEFQSGYTTGTRDLTALRNKVLGKDQVFYAGKLYTAIKNPKQVAKDERRMRSLNGLVQTKATVKGTKKKQAAALDLKASERMRDIQRLKQLGIDSPLNSQRVNFNAETSREVTVEDSKSMAAELKNLHEAPLTMGDKVPEQASNANIDLSIDFKGIAKRMGHLNTPTLNKRAICAKQNAVKWVQANGAIKKCDPNTTRPSENPKKRRLENIEPVPNSKLTKIQENEFFSDRFKKMMAATSSHVNLIENYDDEQQEKYFKKQEMREQLEEKMLTTYKMPCKAVRCLKCKYTNFSASDLCKKEGHPLKVFDTVKRFFKCSNCGNRTVCLEVVPTVACKNCSQGRWERTGMMKERKIDIGAPKLSIRGGEQKFVNSVIADANLDLMVPDE